jgi:transposase
MSQANHTPDDDTLNISERQELFTLRAEKREWLMEREILKKATAFWVKESKG